ncbi:hypothetical protein GCM10022206_12340 [Streptomyces chiangmaiensis]
MTSGSDLWKGYVPISSRTVVRRRPVKASTAASLPKRAAVPRETAAPKGSTVSSLTLRSLM